MPNVYGAELQRAIIILLSGFPGGGVKAFQDSASAEKKLKKKKVYK